MAFTNVATTANMFPAFVRGGQAQKPSDVIIQQFVDDMAGMIIAVLERRFNEAVVSSAGGVFYNWLYSLGLPNMSTLWRAAMVVPPKSVLITADTPATIVSTLGGGTTGAAIPVWPAIGASVTDGSGPTQITWNRIDQTSAFRVLERGNRYGAACQLGVVLATYGVAGARDLAKEYRTGDWEPFFQELNAQKPNGLPKNSGAFDFLFDPNATVASPRPGMAGIAGGDTDLGAAPNDEGISNLLGKFGVDFGRNSRQFGLNSP